MAIEIRAGTRKPYSVFVNEAKSGLREKSEIELHGIGDSISNVIRAGEMLTSQGYATLKSFHTSTFGEDHDGKARNKAKVIISLTKAPSFDKACQDFENSIANRANMSV